MKKQNPIFPIFLLFLTSFLLGVFATLYIAKSNDNILWKTSWGVLVWDTKWLDFSSIQDTYNILKENYYDVDTIEKSALIQWMKKWLVDAMWDRHSEFLTPDEKEDFDAVLSGDFEWIWAVVEKVPIGVEIERIIKGSPAKKYGVRAGDIVLEANGIKLEELSLYDAVDKIKWPAGTSVVLKILRAWETEVLEITVVRDAIKIPSIEEEYLEEENLAYIAVNLFGEETSEEFKKALANISPDIDGLIIDLRDNGGWYLQSAVEILSEFLEKETPLVETKYRKSEYNNTYYSNNSWDIFDKKIVVLINENSASASEITAGTLRKYNKAIVVWKKSYWKWSVQQPFDLSDGSLLKLTIAKWYIPWGETIDKLGIEPDIEIDFLEEDYENEYDRQKEEAKKILQKFIELDALQLAVDKYNQEASIVVE